MDLPEECFERQPIPFKRKSTTDTISCTNSSDGSGDWSESTTNKEHGRFPTRVSAHEASSAAYTSSEFDSSYDSDASYDSYDSSSDYSDEYDDLMDEMLGRKPAGSPLRPSQQQPILNEGIPLENPMAMLQNIRSELEQVGRMIVAEKSGNKFIERARILTSINMLATNLPSNVLEHLGKEIKTKADKKTFQPRPNLIQAQKWTSLDELSLGSEMSMLDEEGQEAESLYDIESDESDSESDKTEEASHSFHSPTKDTKKVSYAGTPVVQVPQVEVDTTAMLDEALKASSQGNAYLSPMTRKTSLTAPTTPSYSPRLFRRTSADLNETFSAYLPVVSYFQCALLFVDISGFTKLSRELDPETLSIMINSYFEAITEQIVNHGGDIQKFAGDALFAEWRCTEENPIEKCAKAAALCANALVRECADFNINPLANKMQNIPGTNSLSVHCGVGLGEMAGIHVGNDDIRREYIYLGDPIRQATGACEISAANEVTYSAEFYEVMSYNGLVPVAKDRREYYPITKGPLTMIDEREVKRAVGTFSRNAKSRGVTEHVEGLEVEALKEYRRLMSLYVHPVVVSNDVAAENDFKSSRAYSISNERHREEAELRSVYTIFINPLLEVHLTGDIASDGIFVDQLNRVMNLVSRELKRYSGHLRQFIVDDKGIVLIATFGLRGSTFPNMVAERALPATCAIFNSLQNELGIDSRIGATYGDAYCGAVGGEKRHEYAIMGPSVNLAARLMASHENPGILVDHAVRRMADRSFAFNALSPVSAKGYKEPVRIYEPLNASQRSWGHVLPYFVGRKDNVEIVTEVVRRIASGDGAGTTLVSISGPSGIGKTSFLAQSMDAAQKWCKAEFGGQSILVRHVGREDEQDIPFKALRPLLQKLLYSQGCENESTNASTSKKRGRDNDTCGSSIESSCKSLSKGLDAFALLCEEFRAEKKIQEATRAFIFDEHTCTEEYLDEVVILNVSLLLVSMIERCLRENSIAIIGLDEAQHVDEMSWIVIHRIFEVCSNVLVLFTGPSMDEMVKMGSSFQEDLCNKYLSLKRYFEIPLGTLGRDEVKDMVQKVLGMTSEEVKEEAVDEVFVKSGGMPRFASEVLQDIKNRPTVGSSYWRNESVEQILLHRIDSLDTTSRQILNIGAIVGSSFLAGDVLAVISKSSDQVNSVEKDVFKSIVNLINDGILRKVEESNQVSNDTVISFYQEEWRQKLLDLTLEARKRDVHRCLAEYLEESDPSSTLLAKRFFHWKESFTTSKATEIALRLAEIAEEDRSYRRQSLKVVQECLTMWGIEEIINFRTSEFLDDLAQIIDETDAVDILSLLMTQGRLYQQGSQTSAAVHSYDFAIEFMQAAFDVGLFEDPSSVFPAFDFIVRALETGTIRQDVYCQYEQDKISKFLKLARKCGKRLHHIHALYLQLKLYFRLGEFEKACAMYSLIKDSYEFDRNSAELIKTYQIDSGVASQSLASFCFSCTGRGKEALRICLRILKNYIPRMKPDLAQAFIISYPLVFVLKANGFSDKAWAFFDRVVAAPFAETSGGEVSICAPLKILLDIATSQLEDPILDHYANWVLENPRAKFDRSSNRTLALLGRCGDSIMAEICLLIAAATEEKALRTKLLDHCSLLTRQATIFNLQNRLKGAQKSINEIQKNAESLRREAATRIEL